MPPRRRPLDERIREAIEETAEVLRTTDALLAELDRADAARKVVRERPDGEVLVRG